MEFQLEKLRKQNRELEELCSVLQVVIENEAATCTEVTKDLFERFSDKVIAHLALEDTALYSSLLTHDDKRLNEMAARYLVGAKELRRLFSSYERHWCHNRGNGNYAKFVEETREMFRLVMDRVQKEDKEFFTVLADA